MKSSASCGVDDLVELATEQGWAIGRLGVEVRESGKWKNPVGLKRLASAGAGLENDYRSRSCVFLKPYPMCDKLCWNSSCCLVTTFFCKSFPAGPPLRNAFGEVLRPLLRFIVILSPAWHEPVNQNRYFDKEQLILSANLSQLPDANMQNSKMLLFQPSCSAISTHRVAISTPWIATKISSDPTAGILVRSQPFRQSCDPTGGSAVASAQAPRTWLGQWDLEQKWWLDMFRYGSYSEFSHNRSSQVSGLL